MNSEELLICKMQAKLFEQSYDEDKSSSLMFIRRFMNSNLAKRFDNKTIIYESSGNLIEELNLEYNNSLYGKNKYTKNELYWIGYIYRYWVILKNITSIDVYKIIKPNELRDLYLGYHSLDVEMAIDRIIEAKNIVEEDPISKGVRILRQIYKKEQNKSSSN